MKISNILVLLIIFLFTSITCAENVSFSVKSVDKINKQIKDAEMLVKKVGRDKIADEYFQKLKESLVELAQYKAKPNKTKTNEQYNELYFKLDNILHPQNIKNNKDSLLSMNKGTGSGVLKGFLRDSATSEVVTNINVSLYDSTGNLITNRSTDNAGRFIFTNLVAGQYTIVSSRQYSSNLISTAYPNIACPRGLGLGCQVSDLNFITLATDEIIENLNISMVNKPLISGHVMDVDDSLPIRYVEVNLYDEQFNRVDLVTTDEFGDYMIAAPKMGNYYVTYSRSTYQLQLYDNLICNQTCDFNTGTVLALAYNQHLKNIDASLQKNGVMRGSVISADTSLPITYANVFILNELNNVVVGSNLQSSNYWERSLRIGNYYVTTDGYYDNYLATKYQNNYCLTSKYESCEYVPGTLISHDLMDTNNIDLEVKSGAYISGVVKDLSGQPISGAKVIVYYESNEQLIGGSLFDSKTITNEQGQYTTRLLGNSSYYLVAEDDSHEIELYNDVKCVNNTSCNFSAGTPITITNLTDVQNVDFQLKSKSSISGTVVDFANNPIKNYIVKLRDDSLNVIGYSYTNENGDYSITNISSGTYQLFVTPVGNSDYYSESYNGFLCANNNCLNDNFTPIDLDNSNLNIDFTLGGRGKVNFNLISNSTGQSFNGEILIETDQGTSFGSFNTLNGISLPAGSYYFYLLHSGLYVPKVFGGSNCGTYSSSCDVTAGTLVNVSDNTEQIFTFNVDEYYSLDLIASPNYLQYIIYNDDLSIYSMGSNNIINNSKKVIIKDSGNKYIKVFKSGYLSQVYDGFNCLDTSCDITQGSLITPQLNSSTSINFNLSTLASISGVITDENNSPIVGKKVTLSNDIIPIYNSLYAYTDENGEYLIDAIPLGSYYIRVNANDNYQNFDYLASTYYGNIACDKNDCSNMGISPVIFNLNDHLINYDIAMVQRGTLSGEGTHNIFNELIGAYAKIYKVEGNSFNYIDNNSIERGMMAAFPLPEGEYKMIASTLPATLWTAFPSMECVVDNDNCIASSASFFITNGNNTHFTSYLIHQVGMLKVKFKDALGDQIVKNGKIDLYDANGQLISTISSDYETNEIVRYLENNTTYKVFIYDEYAYQSKYIAQLYNDIDCMKGLGVDCLISQGQEFSVEHDTIYTINAILTPRPRLKLSLIDKVTNERLTPKLSVFDKDQNLIYSQYFPNLGDSHYLDYLEPGDYYAIAVENSRNNYTITGYPDVQCVEVNNVGSCSSALIPFTINIGDNPKEINIKAGLLGGISGYVKDIKTNQPVSNIVLDLWDESSTYLKSVLTTSNGGFSLVYGTGNYYISTDTNNEYTNEVYQDIDCQNAAILGQCDLTQGSLINVPQNNSSPIIIDVELNNSNLIYVNGFESQ